jgi:hypothetical protein
MHNGPFLRQNWRPKSNNFQLRPNTSVFIREASHFQLQGISAFGNFVIPDPHYFVILFQASILWKPAISWFWRIIYIFWFLRKFFQILNLSSAYFFCSLIPFLCIQKYLFSLIQWWTLLIMNIYSCQSVFFCCFFLASSSIFLINNLL